MLHHSASNHRDGLCMVLCNLKRFSIFYLPSVATAVLLWLHHNVASIIQRRTSYKKKGIGLGGVHEGFLLSHCGIKGASFERIKRLAWKEKELAQCRSRLVTQAWVAFYECYEIKIDWFGLQVLCFLSAIDVYERRLKTSGRSELICLFLRVSLSLLIESIDSNQNNLNLKEHACEFYTPFIVFSTFLFTLSSLLLLILPQPMRMVE